MSESAWENTKPYYDISEFVRLLDRFEDGTLPKDQWNHRAHLAVAAWYLINFGEMDATDRMIAGIRRYNRAQDIRMSRTDGYHETLTLFWLAIGRRFLANYHSDRVLTRINGFIRKYGDRPRLHLDYYTQERIMSWTARSQWVAPDRKPLEPSGAIAPTSIDNERPPRPSPSTHTTRPGR